MRTVILGAWVGMAACTGVSDPATAPAVGENPTDQRPPPPGDNPEGTPGTPALPAPPPGGEGGAPVFSADMPIKPPPSMKVESFAGDAGAGWTIAGGSLGAFDENVTLFTEWLTQNQAKVSASGADPEVKLVGELAEHTVEVTLTRDPGALTAGVITAIVIRPK